ncbi:hypothetical protein [Leucobacter celer]|uniref:hypothetical protein n=1 Tax=Leucobacter celer TaxID=668625 RepID=UPI0006A7675E|nr:hypothetical protein [Leucobacter celer]
MSTIDSARPSRAARAWRGLGGALAATLLAAASHGLAGGAISWLAITATAILALPICTALAGRVGSLWRLAIAVSASQFMYHWLFSWVGAGGTSRTGAEPVSPHAAHLGAQLAPTEIGALGQTASADTAMWAGHAIAALITIALLHRGERAFLALVRLVRRALPLRRASAVPVPPRVPQLLSWGPIASVRSRLLSTVITHRGPPAAASA